jgi:subtilisin family serine protease
VGAVERGAYLGAEGAAGVSFVDRVGHGTAVAAAIREKAPAAQLIAVRVFDRELTTSAQVLARAIAWSADYGARLLNLSLGTSNPAREGVLREALEWASSLGAIVVSAYEVDGVKWLPGSLPGVVGVRLDWELARDEVVVDIENGSAVWRGSGLPRPIPGVPPDRNLSGISFAVANVTGFLARFLEGHAAVRTTDDIIQALGPPA